MMADIIPFNPLDKRNLGASVAEAMLASKVHPLGDLPEFKGAGIYAIYYAGNFAPYAEIAKRNKDSKTAPIYVGKAVPAGARKGGGAGTNGGKPLFNRLAEHAESIRAVENLDVKDFYCRFLVVDDIWIPLGESLLIARYSPVWNALIDGFGNHDPGSGRYNGMRPRWDLLHPGRAWAAKCRPRPESPEDIARDIETYLRNSTFPISDRFIVSDD
ncbi:Eco29kI family restriction endonuclease [Azonexus hydrophilus]|uniref:Eco29kI family restriction endonuclease n=1 Tax=Azonexus hydrophilus TaxID=418702 RepID=UPI00041362E7|nr:Eco29kI family restriction endonuclease [Azonexus hydrophilus]